MKKESIKLTPAQRQSIEQILSKGKALAWTLKHAQVLLKVDRGPQGPGWSTSQIVEAFDSFLFMLLACCQLVAHPVGSSIYWQHMFWQEDYLNDEWFPVDTLS